MRVASVDTASVVDSRTVIRFRERGGIVFGRYRGGRVRIGHLIGKWSGTKLVCDYLQVSTEAAVEKGHSVCYVERLPDRRLRLTEHYVWESKPGTGVNVFEES